MTDLVTFGESMLRLSPPTDQRLERTDTLDLFVAGAESNVAVASQRLGLDATWTSKLPDSPLGRRIVSELHAHGVTTEIAWDEAGRQGTYYVELGADPRGTNVIYDRDDASVQTATPNELPVDRIEDAAAFFTTGITPALSDRLVDTTTDLLRAAADSGTTTVFDANYRSKLWTPDEAHDTLSEILPLLDLLFIAERDAEIIFDQDGPAAEVAGSFATEFDIETVVITQGDAGALAFTDGETIDSDAFDVDTVDPIGSGDAFVGGFLAHYLDGGTVADALTYGSATAALKRTIAGDLATVTPDEVESLVTSGGRGISR